jgi:NAD(P)-dependent dehydrogenase (short-subunit alcohol dehydrogenase family)
MDLGLDGKIAVVTGASRGIGLAIVNGLTAHGVQVIAAARRATPELTRLAEAGQVQIVEVDLAQPGGPADLIAAAGQRIDLLVNNVGNAPARPGGFLSISDADWLATFALNVLAAVRTTREALPLMLAAGGGVIVNTSSVNASLPDPNVIDYGAAKAALANFSKSLSKEFGPRGIRVNTVSPGPVATDLWLGEHGVAATISEASGLAAEDVASQAASQSVTGRFTRPDEVAEVVLFLASERAANITGADVTIDGGLIPTL